MKKMRIVSVILSVALLLSGCGFEAMLGMSLFPSQSATPEIKQIDLLKEKFREIFEEEVAITLDEIPSYTGQPFVVLNENIPAFHAEDLAANSYEQYSELDALGRCGAAVACIGLSTMPTEERESIGSVKPSGWQTVKYDCVDGKYLYNRCHLIGYQLSGENANERNLITGTRYLNVDGMLPFENEVADYVHSTGNHVLYRVTPIFEGNNKVAKGVQMEAMSVEDMGQGIMFHVFCYNVQPGVVINYSDGSSRLQEGALHKAGNGEEVSQTYICNSNTKKFHKPECKNAEGIKEKNKKTYRGEREKLIESGYSPCGSCKP